MTTSFIQENEWDNENIENRIDNEAYVLGIKNFNLIKSEIMLNFTGNLSLIDAVKIIYEIDDSGFNMYRECKFVLGLSKDDKINMSFVITKGKNSIDSLISLSGKLTKNEQKYLDDFDDHIVLMLNIWKEAMIKRWEEYFQDTL
tara:strand:- start:1753 stop:2184 length:432 start_codon:yes stop_codon:yes gene_type:complete